MPYIYQTLSADDVVDAFRQFDRLRTATTTGNFTPAAVRALFEYHEELAAGGDAPIELDVVAWCCDWAQYNSALEAAEEFGRDSGEDPRAWLDDQTTVLDCDDDTIVVRAS